MTDTLTNLASGYYPAPELEYYYHAFEKGCCVKECDKSMKQIGACACDSIRISNTEVSPGMTEEQERVLRRNQRLEREWNRKERQKKNKRNLTLKRGVVPRVFSGKKRIANPRFSRAGMTDEEKRLRDNVLQKAARLRRMEKKKAELDAQMINVKP